MNRYHPEQRVSDEDAALLERHSEYAEKVGIAIGHFEAMSAEPGTQCLRLVRTDGTGEGFSYLRCFAASRAR